MQNNFGPLNDHIIMEFSWVATMAPAVPSTEILGCSVTCSVQCQGDCICSIFAISYPTKFFILGLWNISEWWRGHTLHSPARFGRNFVCHVTYLLISPQGRPRFERYYHGNLQQPVECKIKKKWPKTGILWSEMTWKSCLWGIYLIHL